MRKYISAGLCREVVKVHQLETRPGQSGGEKCHCPEEKIEKHSARPPAPYKGNYYGMEHEECVRACVCACMCVCVWQSSASRRHINKVRDSLLTEARGSSKCVCVYLLACMCAAVPSHILVYFLSGLTRVYSGGCALTQYERVFYLTV